MYAVGKTWKKRDVEKQHIMANLRYPLVNAQKAIEHGNPWLIFLVIFYRYVGLPQGILQEISPVVLTFRVHTLENK